MNRLVIEVITLQPNIQVQSARLLEGREDLNSRKYRAQGPVIVNINLFRPW